MTTTARSETSFTSTLPGRYYYDPSIYELEQECIFSQTWVCGGRAGTISTVGAYQTVSIGRESILIVRNRESKLNAFLNVCRHRGSRLCTGSAGHLKGSIQCRYHAWTYGLDGRLIGAPNVLHDERFDRTAFGLVPVALEVWEGLINRCGKTPCPSGKGMKASLSATRETISVFARLCKKREVVP